MAEDKHLAVANTQLLALLVMHLEGAGVLAVEDFAVPVESSLGFAPEGASRDYIRTSVDALRAKSPESALPPILKLISGGRIDSSSERPDPRRIR